MTLGWDPSRLWQLLIRPGRPGRPAPSFDRHISSYKRAPAALAFDARDTCRRGQLFTLLRDGTNTRAASLTAAKTTKQKVATDLRFVVGDDEKGRGEKRA